MPKLWMKISAWSMISAISLTAALTIGILVAKISPKNLVGQEQTEPQFYVLGDSTSDVGAWTHFFQRYLMNPNYNMGGIYYEGRSPWYGPVGVERVAMALNRPSISAFDITITEWKNPFIPFISNTVNFKKHGNNFAFTGAKVYPEQQVWSLADPIQQAAFTNQVTALINQSTITDKNGNAKSTLSTKDIIYINIGVNDIWDKIFEDSVYKLYDDEIEKMMTAYKEGIQKLINKNGNRFILSNMPSLEESPLIKKRNFKTSDIETVKDLTITFNEGFNQMVKELQAENSNVQIEIQDFYGGFSDFITAFRNNGDNIWDYIQENAINPKLKDNSSKIYNSRVKKSDYDRVAFTDENHPGLYASMKIAAVAYDNILSRKWHHDFGITSDINFIQEQYLKAINKKW